MVIALTTLAGAIGACLAVSICSLTVLPGAVFTMVLSQAAESSLSVLLPVAAGGFIYIAASDLIPILHERCSFAHLSGQSAAFAMGIGFMQLIVFFERSLQSI